MDYFCNPMNIEYKYQFIRLFGKRTVTRETADPSVVLFKGEYYLFSSMLGGFHVSRDLVHWKYYPYQDLPAHDYAPDVEGSFAAENVVGYNILWGHEKAKLYHSDMVFDVGKKVIGALVKGRDYYVRVDTFNEYGITTGEVIKLQQEESHE